MNGSCANETFMKKNIGNEAEESRNRDSGRRIPVYLGRWGFPGSQGERGILAASYDSETGDFTVLDRTEPGLNAGQVIADKERGLLYYVNEAAAPAGMAGGEIYTFRADPETGALTTCGHVPSLGNLPSYPALTGNTKFLVVTHHAGSGSVFKTVTKDDGTIETAETFEETSLVLFRLDPEGCPEKAVDLVRFYGHGASPDQKNPHLHSVKLSPDGKILFVCDKGTDQVYSFRVDTEAGKLVMLDCLSGLPGSSPRYAVFHPEAPYIYFNNETRSVLNTVRYDEAGKLELVSSVSCREDGSLDEKGMQCDLLITKDGRFLYETIRETAQVAVFEIDPETHLPKLIEVIDAGNRQAGRGLMLSPDERFLHVAAMPDNGIITYKRKADGRLEYVRHQLEEESLISLITFMT